MNDAAVPATAAAAESDLHQRDGGGIRDFDVVNAENYSAENDDDDDVAYE